MQKKIFVLATTGYVALGAHSIAQSIAHSKRDAIDVQNAQIGVGYSQPPIKTAAPLSLLTLLEALL